MYGCSGDGPFFTDELSTMVQATRFCSLVVCFIRGYIRGMRQWILFLGAWAFWGMALGQGVPGSMTVKKGLFANGAKVVVDGVTMRPGRAARHCESCWEAQGHFAKAKRLRVWSLVIANLGVAESIVGALRIEDARAVGTAHAVMGGVFMTWAAEKEVAVRREVRQGVDAYNRCRFLEDYL
jgi:hypothetical protein